MPNYDRWIAAGLLFTAGIALLFGVYMLGENDQRANAADVLHEEQIEHGTELYTTHCAACHGENGEGVDGVFPSLSNEEFLEVASDDLIFHTIVLGRPNTAMPTWGLDYGGPLTNEDALALTTFIRDWEERPSGPTEDVSDEEVPESTEVAATGDGEISELVGDPAAGESQFALCAACHGVDARGIPNLGADLVASELVSSLTDEEFVEFIKVGRPADDPANTTGIAMPPSGGNPAMTDADILNIIAYLRSLSADSATTEETDAGSEPTEVAASGDSESSGDPAAGEANFGLCAACHGTDARGIPNLGADLVVSEFVNSLIDEELLTFIKTGRPVWDAANTSGIDMPPKGGNPAMTDADILDVIAYLRSLVTADTP